MMGQQITDWQDVPLKSSDINDWQDVPLSGTSSWGDVKKSFAGGAERGAAAMGMILPNMMNAAVAGPQYLGRGIADTIEGNPTDKHFKPWQPFYSSEEALQMLPPELQPHEPQSVAGAVANFGGQLIGGGVTAKTTEGAGGIIEPFSENGRNQIATRILRQQADNPDAAAQALQNVPEYVPGSKPIGGTASGDLGLIGTEKTLMQNPSNYFGERLGDQNAARTDFMNQVAGDETTVPRYSEMRANATGPLYAKAMEQPLNPEAIKPVISGIAQRIEQVGGDSDAGKMLLALKSKMQGSLPNMEPQNTGLVDESGIPITRPNFENVTSSPLTQIYKETRDQLQAKGMQAGALGSTVRGVIKPVNQQLGEALEAQNPSLAQANNLYAQMSTPINQTENMQTLMPRMTGGIQDMQGNNIFSPAKVGNIMKQGEMSTGYNGIQPLSEALSPEQHQALMALNQDLQRSNAVNIPMVRPPGSNTFNNSASTSDLTGTITGKVIQHIPFFKAPYNAQNAKIMQAMANKMLSPDDLRQALMSGKPTSQILGALIASGTTTPASIYK